jgi:hypothetical protein
VSGARPPSKAASGTDNDEAKYGSNRWLWFPNKDAKLNRTSADPAASERLSAMLNDIKMNIYLAAGLESEDPTKSRGQVQSGIALAFKFQNLKATLSALVRGCQNAENKVWQLISEAWGFALPGETKYPTDFDVADFAVELAGLIQALATQGLPSILREKLVDRFVKRNLNLSTDEQAELDTQMEDRKAMVEGGLGAFPPNESTGGPQLPPKPQPPTPGKTTKK